ncbi:MAG TPA: APC family permease [Acidimicrobiales bacterium]|jgi:amino acid transporter|nr:APC family permease [Acidimicrobiales bacterium]
MLPVVKRVLVGKPLATADQEHQLIPKSVALPVFCSDAISSTAYATEEILFVTAVAATSSLQVGLDRLVPIAFGVAALLAIVVTSYRRTIHAYPQGGGSYVVSRENLGTKASLVAGASILVDYILTVAVSISAGVAAIISIPAFAGLRDNRVGLALVLIALITVANLRGLKESGTLFAVPTYVYIATMVLLVVYGLVQSFLGDIGRVPFDPEHSEAVREAGGAIGLFLLLKGFSSGAVALTGIEAVADGVPAFRKPQAKNASTTLILMAVILGSLFLGTAALAQRLHPFPSHDETVLSQLGHLVFGGGPLFLLLQFATAAILVLAANTAYADFPRLSSIIARDGFLPRQLANRGDRLVFSNGIVFLALAASLLIIAFGGVTNALIPLYAVGVFTSFTLSQLGMVRYQQRHRAPGWRLGATISGFGATVTFGVLLVVATTKFADGAWVPLVVVPSIIFVFLAIKRHYDRVSSILTIAPEDVHPEVFNHTVVVLVGRVHKGVIKALAYAKSLQPNHLAAVFVAADDDDREAIQREWRRFHMDVPLEIVSSPYRDLVEPVERFLSDLDERWDNDTISVVIPEFVVAHWYENVLHNQSALALKLALLDRPGTVVISVPYHLGSPPPLNGAVPPGG